MAGNLGQILDLVDESVPSQQVFNERDGVLQVASMSPFHHNKD